MSLGAGLVIPLARDYYTEVQLGNIPGHALKHKFGRNDVAQNGVWEFINQLAFTAWPLSAATTVRVKAGNAADTAAGNGAREITVEGIDSTFAEITETIATAGAAASSVTTATFWRIHRAWVSEAGTYGAANTANVIIENGTGGTDLIQITIEEGQTQFGGWTVPIDKTAYLISAHAQVDAAKSADIRLLMRRDIDDTAAPLGSKRIMAYFDGVLGELAFIPKSPSLGLSGKTDVWAEARGGGANTEVSIDMEFLVIDD